MLNIEDKNLLKDSLEEIHFTKQAISSLTDIIIDLTKKMNSLASHDEQKTLMECYLEEQFHQDNIKHMLQSVEDNQNNFGLLLQKLSLQHISAIENKDNNLEKELGTNYYSLLIHIVRSKFLFFDELSQFQTHFALLSQVVNVEHKEKMLVDFKVLLVDNNTRRLSFIENEGVVEPSQKGEFIKSFSKAKQLVFKTIFKGTVMSDINKRIKDGVETGKAVVKSYAPKVKEELVKTLEPTIQKTAKSAKDYLGLVVDKIADEILHKSQEQVDSLDEKYKTYCDYCAANGKTPFARDRFEELFKAEKTKVETPKFDIDSIKDELKNINAEQVVKQIVKNVVLNKKGPWGIALSIAFDAIMEAQKESRSKKEAREIAKQVEEASKKEVPVDAIIPEQPKEQNVVKTEASVAGEVKAEKQTKDLTINTKQELFDSWLAFISLVKTSSKKERVSSRGLYENYTEFCKAQELDSLMYNQSTFTRQFKQKMNIKNEEVAVVDGQETRVFNFKMKK